MRCYDLTRNPLLRRPVEPGGVAEILNLQPRGGGQAKPYQVREVVVKYALAGPLSLDLETDDEA